jgi:hypothetical protein
LHFDTAVRQISNPSREVKSFGNMPDGPTETDALNIAFVKYLQRDHANDASADLKKSATARKSNY